MHAGLVPICTREASVDLKDFGILIDGGTVEDVRNACRKFSSMDPLEIERRARRSHLHVNLVHTQEQFAKNYREFAKKISNTLKISS